MLKQLSQYPVVTIYDYYCTLRRGRWRRAGGRGRHDLGVLGCGEGCGVAGAEAAAAAVRSAGVHQGVAREDQHPHEQPHQGRTDRSRSVLTRVEAAGQ